MLAVSTASRPSSWHLKALPRSSGKDGTGEALPDLFPKPRETFGKRSAPTDTKDIGYDSKRDASGLLGPWIQLVAKRPERLDDKSKRLAGMGGRNAQDFDEFVFD